MTNQQYPQYQPQPQYYPQPNMNNPGPKKTVGKALAITLGTFVIIFIILFVTAFFGLRAYQDSVNQPPVFYSSYGGYAESETEVNTDLQNRLDEREELIELINNKYDIEGVRILNNLDEHYFGYSGVAKETEQTAVRVNTEIYLSNDISTYRELVADVDEFFTSRGWTFENGLVNEVNEYQFDSSIGGIGDTAHKDDQIIHVRVDAPNSDAADPDFLGLRGSWVEVRDETETTYPLSEIPVWDGQVLQEDLETKFKPWVSDPENSDNVDKFCTIGENTYIGYWDTRWDCLHAQVWRVDV